MTWVSRRVHPYFLRRAAPAFSRSGTFPPAAAKSGDLVTASGVARFLRGEIASSIVADARAMGGVLSADDLLRCRARVLPAVEVPWRTYTLQTTGALTAAPTAADVVRRMAEARIPLAPDAQ